VTTDADPLAYSMATNDASLTLEAPTVETRTHRVARPVAPAVPPPEAPTIERARRPAKPGNGILRTRLFGSDVLATALCWIALGFAVGSSEGWVGRLDAGLAGLVVTLVAMRAAGLYRSRICARRSVEVARVFVAVLCGAGSFAAVEWSMSKPGPQVAVCGGACLVLVAVLRWHYTRWLHGQRAQGRYLRRVLLVGTNEEATSLTSMLGSEPELGFVVSGVVGPRRQHPSWERLPGVDSVAELPALAQQADASGVLVVPNALSGKDLHRVLVECASANLHVQIWPGFFGVGNRRLRQVPIAGSPFFYLEPKSDAAWPRAIKRGIDVVGSLLVLIVSTPIVLLAALAVKLESKGGIFHRQERVGLDREVFTVYKLRTMRLPGAHAHGDLSNLNVRTGGPLFKARKDPRVTRVGWLLRSSSIDELPQLFNVLQGKMSLVGPRPALPNEAAQFDDELQRRHTMRPGITGLWQIEARENPSFSAYRRWDLHYVDNWSLGLDFSILLATIPVATSHAWRAFRQAARAKSPAS
jgi:exopolysaccharide biosynthesis polyprenyl glycosylphosphotransferase